MRISTIGAILGRLLISMLKLIYRFADSSIPSTFSVPLNIVTSLFGMNVHVPFQHDSPYRSSTAFYVILVAMCGWVFVVLLWARLRGYV